MSVHLGGQGGHFISELWQWRGIAFGQLPYAPGKRLRDTIEFAMHGGGERGQPFVVDDECLDFVLGQLRVFGIELGVQLLLCGFQSVLCIGLFVEQRGVVFERLALIRELGVFADFLEAGLQPLGGDLLLVALAFDDLGQ
jgi:hypothetical protein